MKGTILLFAMLGFTSYQALAQISEGRIQVGGSLGFGGNNTNNNAAPEFQYKTNGVNVSPSIGWFYKPDKLAGLILNFGYSETTYQGVKTINRNYGGGVFFRQYQPVVNKLYMFLDETAAYNYSSANVGQTHGYTIGATVQAGMAYDISKKIQLELSLNRLITASYHNGQGTENYGISTSLEKDVFSNVGFGFRYYLK